MSNYFYWRLFGPTSWPLWLALFATLALLVPGLRRWLRWPVYTGALVCAAMAFTPVGTWLIRPLEGWYPIPDLGPDLGPDLNNAKIHDIIVLTGPEQTTASARSGRLEVTMAGERVLEGAALKRQFPDANLWIVGGVRDRRYPRYDWQWTLGMWQRLGVDAHGIGGTKTTSQNARGVAAAGIGGRPLLVTSAWHMPRAMECFRAVGIVPLAYPVDYQTGPRGAWQDDWTFQPAGNIDRFDLALHEWIGLAVYRLRGFTGNK